jgi:predicted flavoprotein YhiN
VSKDDFADLERLAGFIKALPVPVQRPRPVAEAISTAGGVAFEGLDAQPMLQALPGVFCAGEMLDWEPPHRRLSAHRLLCEWAAGR